MQRYLDAVGLLAGGVAHEINNILAVILSSADLANEVLGEGHAAEGELADVIAAATRAARLTRQLLAFAGKELRTATRIPIHMVVAKLHADDIDAAIDPSAMIEMCPLQLEHVLANLVSNARDAMPAGGRITIEASVDGKGYVALSVTDTGCGIDESIRDRVFEPFFTTKDVGKGLGLGLAAVHGIVQQCGGAVSLSSAVGFGTTVRMYFPLAKERSIDRTDGSIEASCSTSSLGWNPSSLPY